MELKTREQLRREHSGLDISLRVCGNFGEIEATAADEAGAVKEYENPDCWKFESTALRLLRRGFKPKASAIIVRTSDWDGRSQYSRGWIDESRFKWDDDPRSLRYEKKKKKKK